MRACLALLLSGTDATRTESLRRAELRGALPPMKDDNPKERARADQFVNEVTYWNRKDQEGQQVAEKAQKAANGALDGAAYTDVFADPDGDDDDFAWDSEGEEDDDKEPRGEATPLKAGDGVAVAAGELTEAQKDPATAPTEAKALVNQIAALKANGNRTAAEDAELAEKDALRLRWAGLLAGKPELTAAEQVELAVLDPRAQHNAALRWASMIPDGKAGDFDALTAAASKAMHSNNDQLALAASKALVQGETHIFPTVFQFDSKAATKLCDEFQRITEVEDELWRELRTMQGQEKRAQNSFSKLDDEYEDTSMALTKAAVQFALKNNTAEYCRLNVAGEKWSIEEAEYEKDIDHQNVEEAKAAARAERPHMFESAAAFRQYKFDNNAYKSAIREEKILSDTIAKSNASIAEMSMHCDDAEAALSGERSNLQQLQAKLDESLDTERSSKENLDLVQAEVLRVAIKLWRLREKRHALKQAMENMGDQAIKNCEPLTAEPTQRYEDEPEKEDGTTDPDQDEAAREDDPNSPFKEDGKGAAGMDEGVSASARATQEQAAEDELAASQAASPDSSLLEVSPLRVRWVPAY